MDFLKILFRPKQVGLGESSDSPHAECKFRSNQSDRIGHGEPTVRTFYESS